MHWLDINGRQIEKDDMVVVVIAPDHPDIIGSTAILLDGCQCEAHLVMISFCQHKDILCGPPGYLMKIGMTELKRKRKLIELVRDRIEAEFVEFDGVDDYVDLDGEREKEDEGGK